MRLAAQRCFEVTHGSPSLTGITDVHVSTKAVAHWLLAHDPSPVQISPVIVKAAIEMDFTTEKRAVRESNGGVAIKTAKWHLRGDGASLASSRPMPNDNLRKQDAKRAFLLVRPYSSLEVDIQELSTSGCVSAEVAQGWDVCILKSRTRKDSAVTTSAGRRCLGHNGAKDRSTAEVPRGFGQISPLVSQVVMMARLWLVVASRQVVAPLERVPRRRLRLVLDQIRSEGLATVTYAEATANQMTQHLGRVRAAHIDWTNQKIKSDEIRQACSGGGDRPTTTYGPAAKSEQA
ncbi:hypothetical protein BDP55DRAFT_629854 [Colletotrichum godetiae]|uniref:Uncharacterized protein n=1 Tax=Colletotrichum godetiae TaxID=1209918 RepID=A0AAJ0APZ9_9PEZI|nr:uncharacterized protein BDP55DRAFT_629854 [Colletotrichum godetiae]KAK1688252.1 hypothetical protein BDP55DRAFT_629854 [Colletotrichum godetiae]